MKLKAFAVLDRAVGAYLPPFWCRTAGEAERMLVAAVSDPAHQFAKHAEDYTLFYLGEFDDNSGLLLGVEPQRMLSAIECLGPDRVTNGTGSAPTLGRPG